MTVPTSSTHTDPPLRAGPRRATTVLDDGEHDGEHGTRGLRALHDVRRAQADRLLAELAQWQTRLRRQHESQLLLRRLFEDAAHTDQGRLVGAFAHNRLAHRLQLLSLLRQADQVAATTRAQVDTTRALWLAVERQCAVWARLHAMRREASMGRRMRAAQRGDDETASRQWMRRAYTDGDD